MRALSRWSSLRRHPPRSIREQRLLDFEADCARSRRAGRGAHEIVLLGGSLAESVGARLDWVNRGIASERLSGSEVSILDRLGADRLHPNPATIVILVGEMDVRDAPEGIGDHLQMYRHLLARLQENHRSALLAVVSLLPSALEFGAATAAFNAGLREIALAQHVSFWDLHEHAARGRTSAQLLELVTEDGVSPSPLALTLTARFLRRRGTEIVRQRGQGAKLATVLDRRALAHAIVASYGQGCWADRSDAKSSNDIIEAHVLPEIDFFCRYADEGADLFLDLYLGYRARFIAKNPDLLLGSRGMTAVIERDREIWLEHVPPGLAESRARIAQVFEQVLRIVPAGTPKRVRLLFVGDCLLEDIEMLLGGPLLSEGMLIDVDFIVSKSPIEQTKMLKEAELRTYDGIVYSPLTWTFDQEFQNFFEPSLRLPSSYDVELNAIWDRIERRVRYLADAHECPVYVHNTAAVVRASSPFKRSVRALLTYPQRRYAREMLAQRLRALVDQVNSSTFHHLVLVDELRLNRGPADELSLGRFVYYADAIHPTELSVEVAAELRFYIVAAARLARKKVIVCDLDNTLWDGIIGEGRGVRHHRDRQRVLAELKMRGVVLAIASKNDPENVKWDGAVLNAGDFVATEVSWGPKSHAMTRIQQSLNLKTKDFVFIDDRADEREMVTEQFPEIIALDPNCSATWRTFAAWCALIDREGDRTSLYVERAQRDQLVSDTTELRDTRDAAEMFMKLKLELDIRPPTGTELKRVHELINRTSQWNLTGAHCTYTELSVWRASADHVVLTASVRDKFGDMGIVASAVAESRGDALHILVFVLSCRVFGYGVETCLLEELKREARKRFGAENVRADLVETAHNKPCRGMYAAHGFVREDETWVYRGESKTAADPVWFAGHGRSTT